VLWTFWPSLQGSFLFFDESAYVVKNPHVNTGLSWSNIVWGFFSLEYANWHPVTWWSHMLDCQLYGLNPWGHHLTNILIHAANTVLVFVVFRKITGATWWSLLIALLFGLHPLRVASATYISERRDVLSLFFWMLTLWAYLWYAEGKKVKLYYGLAVLFFILGLMSKSMLVTLPFVLLLLDFWPLERWRQKSWGALVLEKIPFFVLTLVVCWLAYTAQHKAGMMREMAELPFSDKAANAAISYERYIGKLFWPANLCAYYPHPGHWPMWRTVSAYALVIGLTLLVLGQRKQRPYLLVGWFWYLGTLVPVIGLVQLLSQSIADRYTYIPMIGLLLMLVLGLKELTQRWRFQSSVLPFIAMLAVVACMVRTRAEIQYYHDDMTLWKRAAAVTENNVHAHFALGVFYAAVSNNDAAIDEYKEAVRLKPDFIDAQNDLGCILCRKKLYREAITHFQAVLRLDPANGNALYNGGFAYFKNGNLDEAIASFQAVSKIYIGDPAPPGLLHACVGIKTETEEMAVKLRDAAKQNPDVPEALNNYAWLLAANPDATVRDGNEAVRLATHACDLTHYQVIAYVNTLALAYAEAGRFDEAIKTAQTAREMASKAGDQALMDKNQQMIESFQVRQPYYEIPGQNAGALLNP